MQLQRITEGGRDSNRWVIFVILRQKQDFNAISIIQGVSKASIYTLKFELHSNGLFKFVYCLQKYSINY